MKRYYIRDESTYVECVSYWDHQAELAKKDLEIAELKEKLRLKENAYVALMVESLDCTKDTEIAELRKDAERLREIAIENVCSQIALENQGIYPQKVVGGDKPYEKRTEAMEAHNEAIMKITKDASRISNFINLLPKHTVDLLLDEKLSISVSSKNIKLYVNCNDVFYWGCADGEEIEKVEIEDLINCFRESPKFGGELWVCRKRGMRPQTACYPLYPKEQWKLFDACGPERTDADGSGRSKLDAAEEQAK